MAIVKPFKAVRPNQGYAEKIAALPYDVMNTEEARKMVENNPLSFLNIDRAEIHFPPGFNPYDPQVYAKAKEILHKMIDDQAYIQDEQPSLYIYRQIMNGRAQTGIVCCASVDDYLNDVIKKHEFTLPEKEIDRINHIDSLSAQTGPIFQTYRNQPEIDAIIDEWTTNHPPVYDFVSNEGVSQICWVINDQAVIDKLVKLFAKVKNLYIADGHHRTAAAVKVGLKRREAYPDYTGDEEFNYFLSVIFPASDLAIMPYNRVIKDLNGLSESKFISRIEEKFIVELAPSSPYEPETKQTFGMYLAGKWYKLTPKPGTVDANDPVKSLDVAILQDNLLEPILNIKDPRTEPRIDFIGGIRGVKELERRVQEDMKVAFSLYPTSIHDVINVADAGRVMPPKSTWFEPKLLSGLFIHLIES